jgi:hypothetical protein
VLRDYAALVTLWKALAHLSIVGFNKEKFVL